MASPPFKERPKAAPGSYSGKGFQDTDHEAKNALTIGIITRVDELNMKADVRVITSGSMFYERTLSQAMSGPRSFLGGVPEVGSYVLLGYRKKHKQIYEAEIIGYVPTGIRSGLRFDPVAPSDPSAIAPADAAMYSQYIGGTLRNKRLKLNPGDVGGMSASGAEFTLSKDVTLTNRAGDLIELRDAERTIVMQSMHSVVSEAGVKRLSGPVRRGALYLPSDIFQVTTPANAITTPQGTLLTQAQGYFGTDVLQAAGPGAAGSPTKYANGNGTVLNFFNDTTNFPPVTYTNGKRVFYAATNDAVNFENGEASGGADAFTEYRMEVSHQTDAGFDVLGEIDGFDASTPKAYIEMVHGTVVGNDAISSMGIRQYGRVLKPVIFEDWSQQAAGKFKLEECLRSPLEEDISTLTEAGAFMYRVHCPKGFEEENPFSCAVSKQGKLFLHVPGSKVERYPKEKNISAEVNLEGALKMFIGAESSSGTSIKLTTLGSIEADIGRNSNGQALKLNFHCSTVTSYDGANDDNNVGKSEDINGNCEKNTRGDDTFNVSGSHYMVVNGMLSQNCDRLNVNAHSGFSINTGEVDLTCSGKAQLTYALAVLENIFTGGKVSTIFAGGSVQNVLAGVYTILAAAGAVSITAGAGAVTLTSGAAMTQTAGAALSQTAGAAMSVTAGLAMSLTAGLAISLTSPLACNLIAPQILLGGPPAVLGVCRGIPMMPPGAPSLDWLMGIPLMGGAMVRSI